MEVGGDSRSRGLSPDWTPPRRFLGSRHFHSRHLRSAITTLEEVRARFARDQGLPFADSLSELSIVNALNEHGIKYRDRVFTPVTTIWGFLSQVLGEDHSCRDTVSRIIAHRASAGLKVCSPNTASYCNARARIPTAVLRRLTRRTAQQLQACLPDGWKWNGRSVFIADGSHVWMPDTPENQAVYPQPVVQQPGIGFRRGRGSEGLSPASVWDSLAASPNWSTIARSGTSA